MTVRQQSVDPDRVALYIRWSTDDQGEGTTLDVQLDGCRHYALSQGWKVSERLTFIDDGYSGGHLQRPALGRLREAADRGEVECVVVYKLDRLSRDVPDLIRLIMDEWGERCCVKSAREPIDTTTPSGKLFFYTLASYAEWERSVIKERTFSGKLRRAQEGKNPGQRPPYGYTYGSEPGSFAAVIHEAAVVRRIYTMYQSGYGACAIAIALNREGVPFRGGRPWHGSTVKYMLQNPAYKGVLVFGATRSDARRQHRLRHMQPHLVRPGVFPVVVPAEQWELVQAIRRQRPCPANNQSGRAHSSANLLTGVLRCANCGRHLRVGGAGKVHRYYRCDGAQGSGGTVCAARLIRQDCLDQLVVGQVRRRYGSELAGRVFMDSLDAELCDQHGRLHAALGEVEAALEQTEGKRRRLRTMVIDGELRPVEYRELVQDIEQRARGLEVQRHLLQDRLRAASAGRAGLAAAASRIDALDSLTRPEQKALLRFFVERIDVYQCKQSRDLHCAIVWRVPTVPEAGTAGATASRSSRTGRPRRLGYLECLNSKV